MSPTERPPKMTTESKHDRRESGVAVLLGAALATLVIGLLATLLGAVVSGGAAAAGALVGALIALTVFAFGSFVVNAVAGLLPSAALLVAVLTYALQVLMMGLVFIVISGSGLLDSTLDRRWLGGTIIAGALVWISAQVALATRRRIPAYDLGSTTGSGPEGSER
ncbi:hypothetical protein [Nocardioides sp.]|uniref:hypothetical protein n=1 Tax=Nocardioides sp. TaxID=35761 RepID=UPI003562FB1C